MTLLSEVGIFLTEEDKAEYGNITTVEGLLGAMCEMVEQRKTTIRVLTLKSLLEKEVTK